jgi:hypothetical protein
MLLIERMSFGKNKRVVAALRPPSCFGYFSPSLAPRGIEPQSGRRLLIHLSFNLDSGGRRIRVLAGSFSIDHFQYVCYMYG